MLTEDFAERARTRVAEARRVIATLREAIKEAAKQLAKIDKQHTSDLGRVYDRLGRLADDVVEELPKGATDADVARAHVIQEQIHDVAADVEEVSLAGGAIEDLASALGDAISEIYARLKEAEVQLGKVERGAAKLGI